MKNLRELTAQATVATLGRRRVARFAQSLTNWARLDLPNKMERNGELLVQSGVLERTLSTHPVFFDVGANVGGWTLALLRTAKPARVRAISVHAFEPCATTRELLTDTFRRNDSSDAVRIVPVALSNITGEQSFYVIGSGAGRNSLYPNGARTVETVATLTLDEYCIQNEIERIELLKIDTEGHDMLVMEGARDHLRDHRIGVLQFEYNHLWISARRYLKDVFDFATPLGYTVAKITPSGLEPYSKWDPELETFREGNYVLATRETLEWFPSVKWWKA